ncbi:MAG TPA: hypothetical protein VGE52_12655, partial [Pirellulales bacterium]
PLEFHCTAPVKANRAQEILYGPTLQQYISSEVIGQTLFEKGTKTPMVVLVDRPSLLGVREFISAPTALVLRSPRDAKDGAEDDGDSPGATAGGEFQIGSNRLRCWSGHLDDQARLTEKLADLSSFDLAEPFGRIRDAIKEAQQAKAAG